MKYRWHDRVLEQRVAKLEKLIYEKSVGRGGANSIAMNMWSFLMDHGPATKAEIEAGLGPRYSNNPTINSYLDAGLIVQRGNQYVANPAYNWDDVGIIARNIPPEVRQLLQSAPDEAPAEEQPTRRTRGRRGTSETPAEEQPTRRARQTREPRAPRAREVKQDLFSRKYEEVKAAIDAGQDCTAANEKGVTPIKFACRDPKGQSGPIVELLLEHGANANDLDGNKYIIFSAIKNKNLAAVRALVEHGADIKVLFKKMIPLQYAFEELGQLDDASMEVVSMLTNETLADYYMSVADKCISAFRDGIINARWYNELITKTYNNADRIKGIVTDSLIDAELRCGVSAIYDQYEKLMGTMPPIGYYSAHRLCAGSFKFAANKLYNSVKNVVDGKLKPYSIGSFLDVYEVLDRKIDGVFNFLTSDYIIEQCKSSRGCSNLLSAIRYAISSKDIQPLQAIAKSKVSILDGNEIISYIDDRANNDKAITAAALRIVSNCKNVKNNLNEYSAVRIARGNNDFLIDWAIDKGYGQDLLDAQSRCQISAYCVKALDEAGFELTNVTPREQRYANSEYKQVKDYIIRLIRNDEWNRSAEEYLRKYPQALTDDEILDEIKDNPESLTARQLQRRVDALPKDPEKYDF